MAYEQQHPPFSPTLFLVVNLGSLVAIFGTIKIAFPAVWAAQLATPWLMIVALFIIAHFCNAFIEFFFHRYVLHAKVIPFFAHFYDAHNLHHNLTRIEQSVVTTNKFPIIEEPQHESSFFPWWTLLVFSLFLAPLYILVYLFFPATPIFLAGYASVFFSMAMYELYHAMWHWPLARWKVLFAQKNFGSFWETAYKFHLRHHANVRCNESVSGFFGIPLPDLIFGTYLKADTLFPDQTVVRTEEFKSPTPRLFIRILDSVLIGK